jgi:chromosome segregation ATPase
MENETKTDETEDTKVEGDGKKEYTPEQQKIDQERSNAKRARAERDQLAAEKAELETHLITLSEELDNAKGETTSIKSELAEIKAAIKQAKSNGSDGGQDDLDNAITDPVVTRHIKKLQSEKSELENQLKTMGGRIGELEKAKTLIEGERVQQTEAQKKANRQETILRKFDTKYGAKYRTEAIALANQKVEESGKAPEGEFEISVTDVAVGDVAIVSTALFGNATGFPPPLPESPRPH